MCGWCRFFFLNLAQASLSRWLVVWPRSWRLEIHARLPAGVHFGRALWDVAAGKSQENSSHGALASLEKVSRRACVLPRGSGHRVRFSEFQLAELGLHHIASSSYLFIIFNECGRRVAPSLSPLHHRQIGDQDFCSIPSCTVSKFVLNQVCVCVCVGVDVSIRIHEDSSQ